VDLPREGAVDVGNHQPAFSGSSPLQVLLLLELYVKLGAALLPDALRIILQHPCIEPVIANEPHRDPVRRVLHDLKLGEPRPGA